MLRGHPSDKFTSREIAEWIFENHKEACREKQNRSQATVQPLDTDAKLIQQISAEIGSQRPRIQRVYPQIKTTEGRPRRFYFTEQSESDEVEAAEKSSSITFESSSTEKPSLREENLYPLLSQYLLSELNVYSKRIDERRSKNNRGLNGNKWLYPDVVGMENLSEEWHEEVKKFVQVQGDKKTKLWSFEVKILINRSNVREVFFQAVSNSSWANLGYLVANDITGMDTIKELRMLSVLHGIGVIQLNSEEPSESQMLIPARERTDADWNNVNRLLEENSDFHNYIEAVREFYQTGNVQRHFWDAEFTN